MSQPTRPVLRYHGGKWRLAPWIIKHLPAHRIYVEPYGGAASVLMRKLRSFAEIYNDLDSEIVNLFRVLREDGEQLVEAVRLTPFSRDEFKNSYEVAVNPIEQARRTVVRSYMGFGSASATGALTGFRANSNRSNSTPAHDWRAFPPALASIVDRLAGVVIENRPATAIIEQHDSTETLFYVDPPYPIATRKQRNIYCRKGYRHEMTDDDHREMAELLHRVDGMVVLSGYPCELYDEELFSGWKRVTRGALADGAKKRTEVLWFNKAAAEKLPLTLDLKATA